jgi:hypothetical protein
MPGLQLTRRAPGWNGNIVAGNTVTLRLPIGLTYHQIWTEYTFSDNVPANILLSAAVDEVRVVANGKPIWNLSGGELDTVMQYQGRTAADDAPGGIFVIDLDRFNLKTRASQELTALGSGAANDPTPLTTLTIELDLATGVDSGSLDTRIVQSQSSPLGLIKKIRRYVNAFGGAGTFEIDDFPKGDLINAVYFFESANDIDRVRLERDDFVMFDRTKELNTRIQTDNVRVPQANLYVYDTTEKGYGVDQLLTRKPDGTLVNDLRWFLEIDGAMTVTSLVEYIGGLEI